MKCHLKGGVARELKGGENRGKRLIRKHRSNPDTS